MRLTPTAIRELLDRHGVEPSRALGQNFMVDANTVDRIVRLAQVEPGDRVVEIGPGVGALTVSLADHGASVLAVEADRQLLAPLAEVVEGLDVEVVHADATELDWAGRLGPHRWKMVANLPYNVATPLVLDVLEGVPAVEELTFLVQREVGERLVAEPGSKVYGLPSLHVSYWAEATIVARVPPTVFHPRPRVESVLVRLVRHPAPPVDADFGAMMALARQAFGQRRKMLRRSLGGRVSDAQFEAASIRADARPETLSLCDWSRLAIVVAAADGGTGS